MHTEPLCVPSLRARRRAAGSPVRTARAQLVQALACGALRSWAPHRPGGPAHLNEQAGEFGGQLSSSRLNVMLHQEAHASDPAHRNGDLWREESATKGSIQLLPSLEQRGKAQPRSPGISRILALHQQPPNPTPKTCLLYTSPSPRDLH